MPYKYNPFTSNLDIVEDTSGFLTDIEITTNSGTATWTSTGNLLGSGSTTVTGAGSTATVALTGLTNHAVLVGAGTSTITKVGPTATAGQVLQSAGSSADPAFSTATYPSTATSAGKILRADGTNWAASTATYPDTAGTSGNVLTSDGTNWISSASGGGIASLKNTPEWFDDFVFGTVTSGDIGELGWTLTQNSGSAFQTSSTDHPGIIQILCTGAANGRSCINTRNLLNFRTGTGEIVADFVVKVDQLSTVTETFTIICGIGDNEAGSDQADGVYFSYTNAVNSGNWTINTENTNVPSSADSGVAVSTNWVNLRIVINAAGTSASFFIDGTQTANSPIATTLPATTTPLGFMHGIFKSVGSGGVSTTIDAFYAKYSLTTPRFL